MTVAAAVDWRLPVRRRGVFLDFYEWSLRHRAFPGCVYYLMPYLRERLGWDEEEALWFAFLNGNTQNPVTSLILHRRGPVPSRAPEAVAFWKAHYQQLAWDTDRRYHKKSFAAAVEAYLSEVGLDQAGYWSSAARGGWERVWEAARGLYSFGRLSAFSYAEYLRIMGVGFDCADLLLGDKDGSRSHRNGLCKVLGLDEYDWHASNPGFDGSYPPDLLFYLQGEADVLLREARERAAGEEWAGAVSYFTLESVLCTYKSWHRPNRRYPGVYNDMLHDRIRAAEWAFPHEDLSIFWEAREACLPEHLRLECNPGDPGVAVLKQNWYRETGEVIVMGHDYPVYWSRFDDGVRLGEFGTFR